MVDARFKPNFYKWVIIKNRHYDVLRNDMPEYESFADID